MQPKTYQEKLKPVYVFKVVAVAKALLREETTNKANTKGKKGILLKIKYLYTYPFLVIKQN